MNNCDKLEPQDADKKQLEDFMDKFADNLDESMYNVPAENCYRHM